MRSSQGHLRGSRKSNNATLQTLLGGLGRCQAPCEVLRTGPQISYVAGAASEGRSPQHFLLEVLAKQRFSRVFEIIWCIIDTFNLSCNFSFRSVLRVVKLCVDAIREMLVTQNVGFRVRDPCSLIYWPQESFGFVSGAHAI